MKLTFLALLTIVVTASYAQQDSIQYLNKNGKPTSKDSAVYYSLFSNSNGAYKRKDYNIQTGKLSAAATYADNAFKLRQGPTLSYHENGGVKDSIIYENGKRQAAYYFYENGTNKALAIFANGKVAQQKGWDENGNEIANYIVEEASKFPGGPEGWRRYLERNLNANVAAESNAPPGNYTVKLQFLVGEDGTITQVKAVTIPVGCSRCADEAVRVIQKGPKWLPAIQFGKPTRYLATQFITFQVSQEKSLSPDTPFKRGNVF